MKNPVPLHIHNDYNVLDGMLTSKEIIDFCKKNNIPGYAMTSHGHFQHFAYYYMEAPKYGLKFVIGLEAYIGEHRNHITILPKSWNGLKSVLKINNEKVIEQQYGNRKKRVTFELNDIFNLKECIILSGCLNGLLNPNKEFNNGDVNKVDNTIKKFKDYFKDDFYLEIMPYRGEEQIEYNKLMVKKSREFDIPLVVTTDSHYAKKEDALVQKYLMACARKKSIDDIDYFDLDDFFLYTGEEIKKHLTYLDENDILEAIENTYRILDKINQDCPINNSMVRQPSFEGIPKFYWEKENKLPF